MSAFDACDMTKIKITLEISPMAKRLTCVSVHMHECDLGKQERKMTENFPFSQLELITELLGTPSMEDMRHACDGARTHMLRRVPKQPSLSALYTLSSHATHEAVHLLCQMLVFDPVSTKMFFKFVTNR
jgi:hypothetical protein